MLHYEGDKDLPLKIEVSLRDSAQFDEKDVRVINGVRVYSIEKLAELKTEAFLHRVKARDIYNIGFLLNKHPNAIQPETLSKITDRVKDFGIDYLNEGEIIAFQDGQAIQEISPGVAIGHSVDKFKEITKADIGKDFTISYDNKGSVP